MNSNRLAQSLLLTSCSNMAASILRKKICHFLMVTTHSQFSSHVQSMNDMHTFISPHGPIYIQYYIQLFLSSKKYVLVLFMLLSVLLLELLHGSVFDPVPL